MRIPGDFSVPKVRYHSTPRCMTWVTLAIDSTLLTMVGLAYNPSTAGKGGFMRGWPR
jgi:hypothetical protein